MRGLPRVFAATALLASAMPLAHAAVDLEAGRRVFESVCVVCHGATGQPDADDPVVKGLGVLPADLSDPLFNSREPQADWLLVVKHGGAALGLSAVMPAHRDALSEEDIENVVAYIKTLADTRGYPPGEFNLMLAIRTGKAFPEDELVWKSRVTERAGRDEHRNVFEVEKRVGARGQVLLELIESNSRGARRLDEVQAGYKHALWWNLGRGSLLSGSLVLAVPTYSAAEERLLPGLAFAQILSDRATLQVSGRAVLPFDDLDQGAVEFATALHWTWSDWPRRVFPGIEITATAPFTSAGADSLQWTLVPQLRFGLTRGGHVALNLGAEIPLSDQPYDRRWHLNLLWDFADGSFLRGWR